MILLVDWITTDIIIKHLALTYRPCVVIFILNKKKKKHMAFLTVQRLISLSKTTCGLIVLSDLACKDTLMS